MPPEPNPRDEVEIAKEECCPKCKAKPQGAGITNSWSCGSWYQRGLFRSDDCHLRQEEWQAGEIARLQGERDAANTTIRSLETRLAQATQAGTPYSVERDTLNALTTEVARLEKDLAPFRPMSIEQAEAEMDAVEAEMGVAEPIPEEKVQHMVKMATDASYRADHYDEQYKRQWRINRGLRVKVTSLTAQVERLNELLERARDWLTRGRLIDEILPLSERELVRDLAAALARVEGRD